MSGRSGEARRVSDWVNPGRGRKLATNGLDRIPILPLQRDTVRVQKTIAPFRVPGYRVDILHGSTATDVQPQHHHTDCRPCEARGSGVWDD